MFVRRKIVPRKSAVRFHGLVSVFQFSCPPPLVFFVANTQNLLVVPFQLYCLFNCVYFSGISSYSQVQP